MTRSILSQTSKMLVGLLCVGALTSCTALVSDSIDMAGTAAQPTVCQNAAGAYALPRTLITFDVTRTEAAGNAPATYDIEKLDTKATADPDHVYCLDFLASDLANDKIAISRTGLLLNKVASTFDDKTLDIASQVIDATAQAAVSAGPRGKFGRPEDNTKISYIEAQFEFDPFSHDDMIKVNSALQSLDHCVFLDPTDDPYVPDWQANLCSGYRQVGGDYPYYGLPVITADPPARDVSNQGILYRPLLTHKLVIMKRNHDPVGPRWQLFQTMRVAMANAAPAFVLEVNRSAFVARKMSITFSNGVLQNVDIVKPSEADAFAGLALRAVQVMVSIPVRALIVGQTDAKNRQALIVAQAKLIDTLRQYNKDVQDFASSATGSAGGADAPAQTRAATAPVEQTSYDARVSDCMRNAALITSGDPYAYCSGLAAGGQPPAAGQ